MNVIPTTGQSTLPVIPKQIPPARKALFLAFFVEWIMHTLHNAYSNMVQIKPR